MSDVTVRSLSIKLKVDDADALLRLQEFNSRLDEVKERMGSIESGLRLQTPTISVHSGGSYSGAFLPSIESTQTKRRIQQAEEELSDQVKTNLKIEETLTEKKEELSDQVKTNLKIEETLTEKKEELIEITENEIRIRKNILNTLGQATITKGYESVTGIPEFQQKIIAGILLSEREQTGELIRGAQPKIRQKGIDELGQFSGGEVLTKGVVHRSKQIRALVEQERQLTKRLDEIYESYTTDDDYLVDLNNISPNVEKELTDLHESLIEVQKKREKFIRDLFANEEEFRRFLATYIKGSIPELEGMQSTIEASMSSVMLQPNIPNIGSLFPEPANLEDIPNIADLFDIDKLEQAELVNEIRDAGVLQEQKQKEAQSSINRIGSFMSSVVSEPDYSEVADFFKSIDPSRSIEEFEITPQTGMRTRAERADYVGEMFQQRKLQREESQALAPMIEQAEFEERVKERGYVSKPELWGRKAQKWGEEKMEGFKSKGQQLIGKILSKTGLGYTADEYMEKLGEGATKEAAEDINKLAGADKQTLKELSEAMGKKYNFNFNNLQLIDNDIFLQRLTQEFIKALKFSGEL